MNWCPVSVERRLSRTTRFSPETTVQRTCQFSQREAERGSWRGSHRRRGRGPAGPSATATCTSPDCWPPPPRASHSAPQTRRRRPRTEPARSEPGWSAAQQGGNVRSHGVRAEAAPDLRSHAYLRRWRRHRHVARGDGDVDTLIQAGVEMLGLVPAVACFLSGTSGAGQRSPQGQTLYIYLN